MYMFWNKKTCFVPRKSDKPEWARLLYKSLIEDIRFGKSQQLKVVYYNYLLYGAILFIVNKYQSSDTFRYIYCFLVLILSLISLSLIWKMNFDIVGYRRHINEVRGKYKKIYDILTIKDSEKYISIKYDMLYLIIFHSAIILGYYVVIISTLPRNIIEICYISAIIYFTLILLVLIFNKNQDETN